VTVPVPFEFLNQQKGFSIRQKKVEKMVRDQAKEEERALSFEYKAREVPPSVKTNKFEQMEVERRKRSEDNRKFAMAKIKATEKPFNFYKRDEKARKVSEERAELPADVPEHAPFRAGKIPWKVLVPLYQSIVDKDDDRNKRVKRNAEVSLKLAQLPPRMEQSKIVAEQKKKDLEKKYAHLTPSFKPKVGAAVPDFKRAHKDFAAQLEKNKGAFVATTPKGFNFHEPKMDVSLRKHLDEENQLINPTLKKRATSVKNLNADLEAPVCPPTTKKHEAMAAMRRSVKIDKQATQEEKVVEEHARAVKAARLTNRVRKSPGLSSNAAQLKRKRMNSIQRAKDQMKYLENVYNQQKAIMEFNVANRPLLVEQ
jgi:hypothetical protein